MPRQILILWILMVAQTCLGQSFSGDEIVFGDAESEKNHGLKEISSRIIRGALNQSARELLPIGGERVEGGNVSFTMRVDPGKQNYFTARFWGSDVGNKNILILFCNGKQIGYRHLGDYDMINIANEEAPSPGHFIYSTLPLPLSMTKGKTTVQLSIKSTGPIFRYGETFDKYQKPMEAPAKPLYNAYTHTEEYLAVPAAENIGESQKEKKRRIPGKEVLDEIKTRVNKEIDRMLAKELPDQTELWILADAYQKKWTPAYKNEAVIEKVIAVADNFHKRLKAGDKTLYENSWITVGPLCISIRAIYSQLTGRLDEKLDDGQTRKDAWSDLLGVCLQYAKTHRRQYTNQSMIVDLHLYHVNRVLQLIDPSKALSEQQTLQYLYQSVGIKPWLGSETSSGPAKPLGNNYYQATAQGLTRELGFVGGYGEILNWVVHIYEATGEWGIAATRDTLIRKQLLKMLRARSYFRYPALDRDGNKAMRAEAVVGWRDHDAYPGTVLYGEKGLSRESTPFMAAAATLDPTAVAYVQQMMDDNQLFNVLKEKLNDRTLNSTQMLLRVPDEYDQIKRQPRFLAKLPMTDLAPDFVFSDEEDGVVALKNGKEMLYISLYWRANFAVNFLARVHYITPSTDRVATVFQDVKYTSGGYMYKRPDRVNLFFSDARKFYPGIESAHAGEELPVAKIPDGIEYKPGQESIFAGKGDFYTLRYGKYLIGMNCTLQKTFELSVPEGNENARNLSADKVQLKSKSVEVKPMSTIVIELND